MSMRLTITLDMHAEPSMQQATKLVERWLARQLDLETWQLRPLKIRSAYIDLETLPTGDMARVLARSGGADILRRRKALGLGQRELGALANVTAMTISLLENDKVSATSSSAAAVRRALDELEAAR